MSDVELTPPSRLHWPDDIDESTFLDDYWQQRPLLLRQAFPDFETPLPADELAGLALEPDTTPRLIRRDEDGHYWLAHGPFDEEMFTTLGAGDWSLLVTDVEKHLPELQAWLAPFRFVPDWRFDDLMVSYAPEGASVGAHVDQFDVFLLQASGTRRWSIDTRPDRDQRLVAEGDLRLIADFEASETWDLVPGDILYLPPGVAHHGIAASEDCTTWSIGFRAPGSSDIVMHLAEAIAERLSAARLKVDGERRTAPGEISSATVDAVAAIWSASTRLDRNTLTELSGTLLTRAGVAGVGEGFDEGTLAANDTRSPHGELEFAPFAQLAWSSLHPAGSDARTACDEAESVCLFVNGESLSCTKALAIKLCQRQLPDKVVPASNDADVLDALLATGVLVPSLADAGDGS